jgi:hypothetical protein
VNRICDDAFTNRHLMHMHSLRRTRCRVDRCRFQTCRNLEMMFSSSCLSRRRSLSACSNSSCVSSNVLRAASTSVRSAWCNGGCISRDFCVSLHITASIHICMYVCIFMYVKRRRERKLKINASIQPACVGLHRCLTKKSITRWMLISRS